jgi:hypothetical protein
MASSACDAGSLCHKTFLPAVASNYPYHPSGFGVAGSGNAEKHAMWHYDWGYRYNSYGNTKYLPMLWGGPPSDSCTTNPPSHCTCNWTGCQCEVGTQCNPGCANARTSYEPSHVPGCSSAQREAFAQKMVDFVLQDPGRRQGRNWLIYNEPENPDQAALDAGEAAELFNVIYDRMKAIDPAARFYCCGTMVDIPGRRQWMADFAKKLARPLDGIHYHNYYTASWFDATGIIQAMKDFYVFMQGVTSAAGQNLGGLDMIITEWAGLFPKDAVNRCAGANNRDRVMRPVARWLNSAESAANHVVGAAWFYSGDPDWPGCSLFEAGANTCLADEYLTYRWGQVP